MRRPSAIAGALALFVAVCLAQTVLTNDAILKMAKAGLGEDILVSTIKAQPGSYTTAPDDLIALKGAGVQREGSGRDEGEAGRGRGRADARGRDGEPIGRRSQGGDGSGERSRRVLPEKRLVGRPCARSGQLQDRRRVEVDRYGGHRQG